MAGMGNQAASGMAMGGTGSTSSMGGMGGGMMGGGMMDSMMGFLGDHILVNGKPNAILPLATHAYRLRLLNGSNARIYKLAWSDGRPMTVWEPTAGCWHSLTSVRMWRSHQANALSCGPISATCLLGQR